MKLRTLYLQQKVLRNRRQKWQRAETFWQEKLDRRKRWFIRELKIRQYWSMDSSACVYCYGGESFESPSENGFQMVTMTKKDYVQPKIKPSYIFRLGGFRVALAVPYKYHTEIEYFVEVGNRFVSVQPSDLVKILARIKKVKEVVEC